MQMKNYDDFIPSLSNSLTAGRKNSHSFQPFKIFPFQKIYNMTVKLPVFLQVELRFTKYNAVRTQYIGFMLHHYRVSICPLIFIYFIYLCSKCFWTLSIVTFVRFF